MRKGFLQKIEAEEESGIDLTPMLDVLFIMLIFFVVTASFVKETGINVDRPKASTAESKRDANILVAINANNEIWIDRRRIDIRSIRANIERLLAENPKGKVIIMADGSSDANTYAAVADAAREAGVYDISLAVDKK